MNERIRLMSIEVLDEIDVVSSRQSAKKIAADLGMSKLEQIRIATTVSELARNVYQYASSGTVHFDLQRNALGQLDALYIEIIDRGPGITALDEILNGSYVSATGMGVGLRGARRLMDEFDIHSTSRGTRILGGKRLHPPRPFPSKAELQMMRGHLEAGTSADPYTEIKEQAQELLLTTAELQTKKDELEAINLELENTNQGVVALYSELEKTAQELQEASESKNRFFSNMTHEFRSPINIIDNISRLLLEGSDGTLTHEQRKQVRFISDAATELAELVNELLDLAEAQSGRLEVVPERFSLFDFIEQLRQFTGALSMRYPALTWEVLQPTQDATLHTDRGRLFQIMRNLIGNAFKYTPSGLIRVQVFQPDNDTLEFVVEDSGIGISEENQARIFEEFCRLRTPGLTNIQGTGLGLSLARQLAGLLRGDISLTSEPGRGSRFQLHLPRHLDQDANRPASDLTGTTVLIIDDNEADRYLLSRLLQPYHAIVLEAQTASESIDKLYSVRPDVIFLDLDLPDFDGAELLMSMDRSLHAKVVINTAKALGDAERAQLAPLAQAILAKGSPGYAEAVLQTVQRVREGFNAH
ncbi:ATP-binding protein [Stutzerimonas tarimensis]|uniref:histidine kinase n=1 Tax=Stutzerimonas tarimensis TaxID=1507735 RepID=A0ABV7T6Z6_9GAMM